jgi:hypothetical protein
MHQIIFCMVDCKRVLGTISVPGMRLDLLMHDHCLAYLTIFLFFPHLITRLFGP